jgi:phospholipid/cholesterol/gamma-HCH transport system permease protein
MSVRAPRAASPLEHAAREFGRASAFAWRVMRSALSPRLFRYAGEVLRQTNILITGTLLIILVMVFSFGLVIGIEASYGARLVGAPSAAGAFTAIGDLREIIPYAFGYIMAAKVSTGIVAELGTMRIADEIDALDVMGFDSVVYLASTRLVASWLILPFVYAVAVVTAFLASFIAVVLQIGQTSAGGYLELFWKFQNPGDLLFSGAKGMAMSRLFVMFGCFYGYNVRGGRVEVGRATAKAMVVNLVGVHAIGILGSQLFWGGAPRLPIGG